MAGRETEEKEMPAGIVVRGLRKVRTLLADSGCARGLAGKELVRTTSMLIRQTILDSALEIRPG